MKNKKKVLIITMSMASGGTERVISLLLQKLSEDFEVSLLLFFKDLHYEIPSNVRLITISDQKRLNTVERIWAIPKVISYLRQYLKMESPDISISFLTQPNIINSLLKRSFPNIRTIISERSYPSIEYRSSKVRYYLYKYLLAKYYNKADVIFSNSEWINRDLKENFGVCNREMKVIYNPIVLPKTPKSFNSALLSNSIKLINVGRLIKVKNQSLIIDAVSGLLNYKFELFLVGEGPLKASLRRKVNNFASKPNVRFIGNVNNVNQYLIDSDCFILSSNSEGFPNSLLEAMAMGLPVISSNCKSGPLELINDNEPVEILSGEFVQAKYGLLFNPNDIVGLQKAILFFSDNREKMIVYGMKGRERAKNFNLDNIYRQFRTIIDA